MFDMMELERPKVDRAILSFLQRNFCGPIRAMTRYYVSLTEYGRASLSQKLIRLLCIVVATMTTTPAASGSWCQ